MAETNKITSIFFLIEIPPTVRDYERFGFPILLKRGFHVKFLDLTALINPQYKKELGGNWVDAKWVIRATKREDFESFLKSLNLKETLIISCSGLRFETIFVFEAFARYQVSYALNKVNAIPEGKFPLHKRLLMPHFLKNAYKYLIARYFRKKYKVYYPQFVIEGGKINADADLANHSKVVWMHALDYDRFLDYQLNKSEPVVKGKYAVFLDESLFSHPDFSVSGMYPTPFKTFEEYEPVMNSFFKEVENQLGLPVVIAAHPKSEYENHPGAFNARAIYKNKTIDLVANADYVLAHSSTSVNFAVLFNKPVIFLFPEEYRGSYLGIMVEAFAESLGQMPFDQSRITQPGALKNIKVSEKHYLEYKTNYIKVEHSPKKYGWEIFADALEANIAQEPATVGSN